MMALMIIIWSLENESCNNIINLLLRKEAETEPVKNLMIGIAYEKDDMLIAVTLTKIHHGFKQEGLL